MSGPINSLLKDSIVATTGAAKWSWRQITNWFEVWMPLVVIFGIALAGAGAIMGIKAANKVDPNEEISKRGYHNLGRDTYKCVADVIQDKMFDGQITYAEYDEIDAAWYERELDEYKRAAQHLDVVEEELVQANIAELQKQVSEQAAYIQLLKDERAATEAARLNMPSPSPEVTQK